MAALFDSLDGFQKRMRGVILPFWASEGFMPRLGQFCERTNLKGEPVQDVPLRAMVQARQIFVYTNAERTGEMHGGGERALEALDSLLNRYSEDGDLRGGLAYSISPAGDIVSAVRDSYTHAFALFALASAYRLTKQPKLFQAVEALTAFIDASLADRQGGLFDCYPNPGAVKLQNPVMHMLEAYLALHEAWPDHGFLDRAADIVRLFREWLFQPGLGVLLEKYRADWTATEPAPGTFFEPGHQFEWAWLLNWFDSLAGTDHRQFSDRLWTTACAQGFGPGWFCLDEVAMDPTLSKRSSRAWPYTEGIKAAVIRREAGDLGADEVVTGLLTTLDAFFLGRPFPAGWMDRIAANGDPIADVVPTSTLYHLYSAFKETSRVVTREVYSFDQEPGRA
jgi:mannose/cellobiose epimerase-like protein (N-acyl-D-glucosamine 2-epimerase family)